MWIYTEMVQVQRERAWNSGRPSLVCPPNYPLHRGGPERARGRGPPAPSRTVVRLHVQCPFSDQEATWPSYLWVCPGPSLKRTLGDWEARARPLRGPPHTSNRNPSVRGWSPTSQVAAPPRDTGPHLQGTSRLPVPALLVVYWVPLRTGLRA